MSYMERVNMQILIEKYIEGKLSRQRIEMLWLEILKHPRWMEYLKTMLHLRILWFDRK
ncbi:MAG: hypothetical protein WD491_10110 [Balneolales bacterium]